MAGVRRCEPSGEPAAAIEGIERLSCTLEVAHGLSIGQNLASFFAQQGDQLRDPCLYRSKGHLAPPRLARFELTVDRPQRIQTEAAGSHSA